MPDQDLTPDDIVRELTPSGADEPEDVVVLVGFLGESDGGRTRIYADDELRLFVEVPTDEIVRRQRIPEEADALGGRSKIWVRRRAMELALKPRRIDAPQDVEDDFLTGDLLSNTSSPTTLGQAASDITLNCAVERIFSFRTKRYSCC